MDATTFRAEAQASIDRSKSYLDAFLQLDASAPDGELIAAVDAILTPLNGIEGRAQLFAKVHPDAAMRESALTVEQQISGWLTELSLNRELYDRIAPLESSSLPDADHTRIVELVLRSLRRAGVDRDEPTRNRVKELKDDAVKIGQEFDKNIITDSTEFVIEDGAKGLEGLPQDFIDAHPENADGHVTLTTDPQDRQPFFTFAKRGDLRKRYYHCVMNRAAPANLSVLGQLMRKRHDLAQLIGYDDWASYITEDKMVKSAKAAREFIERVIELSRPRAEREYQELLEEKRREDPEATTVYSWERGYLAELVRKRCYDFDSQSVRPYLPYTAVQNGVLATTERVYDVEIRRNTEIPVWHETVECYDVIDGGTTVARFFLDMHPRENKYKHAAMFDMTAGVDGKSLPEACLVCNFAEPSDKDPALMLRSDVRTLFHEFGHLMHHLFSRQRFVRLAGISCEWDFVEVPSQLYEEWAWDYDVLSSFAKHHQTGEPIPRELVDRMRQAEEYGKGIETLTQMYYSMISLSFYDRDPEKVDPVEHMVQLNSEILPFPYEQGTHFIASFGHLNGYSAMYYTYMWSLVIAKDLFSRFESEVMNRSVANEYRDAILSRGGSKEAAQLVRDFLGRDYAFDAFERWLNK